jgi:hypothetical protein
LARNDSPAVAAVAAAAAHDAKHITCRGCVFHGGRDNLTVVRQDVGLNDVVVVAAGVALLLL